jgi:hypothetical protein
LRRQRQLGGTPAGHKNGPVPRTSNPNDEVKAFEAKVDASLDLWVRTQDALQNADLALRKDVSLDAFLRVAVAWEGFRSDWHLAAINRNSAAYPCRS